MSVRNVKVSGTTVNAAGAAQGGVGVQATLVVPAGVRPVDTAGESIDVLFLTTTSDPTTGVYTFDPAATPTNGLIAPGDIDQYVGGVLTAVTGAYWVVQYVGKTYTSPSFVYTASTIDPTTWASGPAAPATLGKIKCALGNVAGSGAPVTGRLFSVSLSEDAFWTGGIGTGQRIPGNTPEQYATDSSGVLSFYVIRTGELNPSNTVWTVTDLTNFGNGYFQAPATYGTHDQGVYNAGTTYASGDIVRRAADDVPFVSQTAGNVGNALTDVVHWLPYAGVAIEPLLTYTAATPSSFAAGTLNILHDASVPVLVDSPVQSPATLHDDLLNLANREKPAMRAAGKLYASQNFI